MKLRLTHHLLAALIGVVFTAELQAQTTAFTYQGRLSDNGEPASGSYDLVFSLHDAGTGGNQVGSFVTNNAVALSDGLFSVLLDFGANVFTNEGRWLQIAVRSSSGGAFTALSPRQELTPVPTALYALTPAGPRGETGPAGPPGASPLNLVDTNAVYVNGNVGIGTSTPREKLEVEGGNIRIQGVDGYDAPGESAFLYLGSTSNYIKSTRSFGMNLGVHGAPDAVTILRQTGNVGIGTTNPATALQVVGTVTADGFDGPIAASQLTGTIAPGNIAPNTITSTMLAKGSVTSVQLAPGAVTTASLADGAVTAAKVARVSNWHLALTITNPAPESGDLFGITVAGVGTDRVLIGAASDDTGATNAGAVYLFSANGALLTTFTNPAPAYNESFGHSVAAVGTDRVLIGAPWDYMSGLYYVGTAYLFSTNGALLTTFTNPTPEASDWFANSVAAVGTDQVLIGAENDNTGATSAGAAYLFTTSGVLLTTFTNPTPAVHDRFGNTVAAIGSGQVLIGALSDDTGATDAGAAYLFSTNGALLTTFTNPTPAASDFFGSSVAAVGADRVLIGAVYDDTGATDAGVAYLFSTNGALLTTFTNPTPARDYFGGSVAAVGTDRVLIGARDDDTGANYAGVAYLFSTGGALLTTFTNPTPAYADSFGGSVAAVGAEQLLIAAYADDTGTTDAGAAYLFSAENYTPGLVAEGVRTGSITTTSLADGAVTADKILNGSVAGVKIANGSITGAHIVGDAITGAHIQNGAIKGEDIKNYTINGDKIQFDTLYDINLVDEPGLDWSYKSSQVVGSSLNTLASVTLDLPTSGFVVVLATATGVVTPPENFSNSSLRFGISTSNTAIERPYASWQENYPRIHKNPLVTQRVYVLYDAGPVTFYFLAIKEIGADFTVNDANITAMFFPTRY